MKKTIFHSLVIALFFATFCTGCLDDPPDPRTPEMEQEELNTALEFLESDGYDIDTTDLGIYYIQHREGSGPMVMYGDTLRLMYTGYLLDGRIFDASAFHHPDSIWEFVFEENALIPGFEDGLKLMNKGSKIEIIVPSELAYGEYGNGGIGPYTTLVFLNELRDINPYSDTINN